MARVTMQQAKDAANKATKMLSEELRLKKKALRIMITAYLELRVPAEIMKLYKKHSDWFVMLNYVYVQGNGFKNYYSNLDHDVPKGDYGNNFEPTKAQAKEMQSLINDIEKLEGHIETTKKQIENTLLTLSTHKRVADEFPEIYPFIKLPEQTKAVVHSIAPIREAVKKLLT